MHVGAHHSPDLQRRSSCLHPYLLITGLIRAAQKRSEVLFFCHAWSQPTSTVSNTQPWSINLCGALEISSRSSAGKAASQREGTSLPQPGCAGGM